MKEMKSGPQTGDSIGAFNVTKLCGAEDDGVEAGKTLCYRCKNGKRPASHGFHSFDRPKSCRIGQEA